MTDPRDAAPLLIRPLTERQELVVAGLCRGWTNAKIAHSLGVATSTIKGHLIAIDNILTGPRDEDVSRRERVRLFGLHRLWEKKKAG